MKRQHFMGGPLGTGTFVKFREMQFMDFFPMRNQHSIAKT